MSRAVCLTALLVLLALPALAAEPAPAPPPADAADTQLCPGATSTSDLELFLDLKPQTHIGRTCGSCVEYPTGTCDGEATCTQVCECQCNRQYEQCSSGCLNSPGCWITCEQQAVNCYDCCSLVW